MFIDLKNPRPRQNPRSRKRVNFDVDLAIPLERPKLKSVNVFDVLVNRHSGANLSPISMELLTAFLWFSCRTHKIVLTKEGRVWQHRPSPSAGGIHPIDLILFNVPKFEKELFFYDATGHVLKRLRLPSMQRIMRLREKALEVKNEPKSILIWFVAQPQLIDAYYQNPESLLWRDAGALLGTCYLVATALRLRCCALGITGDPFISKAIHPDLRGAGGLFLGA
jgi:SagB-type dehydrogenase family enzyme